METAIGKTRAQFRDLHKIPENGTVIFFAPGNEISEAEFCLENVRRGVKEFLLKYSSPTSLSPKAPPLESYTTIISLHRGSDAEQFVKDFLHQNEWYGKVQIVYNDINEHIEAMAASDLGIIYDGQMVGSAVACHLPTMIVANMRMHHQWYHDLFNRWLNSMNILADNNIYPELIGGEVWFGKICDTLAQWYVKPEIRYDKIRKWEYFMKEALSFKPVDRTTVRSKYLILNDGQTYEEFKDPFHQVATHIWKDMSEYELKAGTPLDSLSNVRVTIGKY